MLSLLVTLALTAQDPHQPLFGEPRGPVDTPQVFDYESSFGLFELADFDGVPGIDLFLADTHRGTGAGRFERSGAPPPRPPGFFLDVFDFEDDGDLDVLAGPDLRVFVNQGGGTFVENLLARREWGDVIDWSYAARADFNRDGLPDFVYSNEALVVDGGIKFRDSALYLSPGYTRSFLAASCGPLVAFDRDGDGLTDIVGFDIPTGTWFVHGTSAAATSSDWPGSRRGSPGDGRTSPRTTTATATSTSSWGTSSSSTSCHRSAARCF